LGLRRRPPCSMNFFHHISNSYQSQATIVTSGLGIHYDFRNAACYPGSGNVVTDLSGNGRSLVFVNLATWTGTYFDFDGVNDYGSISNIASVDTAGSVGYWIRLNTTLSTTLLQRISGINANWEFGRLDAAGEPAATGCSPANVPTASITADLGTFNNTHTNGAFSFTNAVWANLVFTWSIGGTAQTYINGSFVHSCAPVNAARTGTWTIGRSPGNTARYYFGQLGWFTYYNRQLSGTEILQNFNVTKSNYGY